MTISSEVRKAGPFIGNGVTTSFPFTFKVFAIGEVLVVRTGLDGVESTLSMLTDYVVTLNGNQDASPGGTVSTPIAPAAGVKITITSRVQNTQALDLTNQGGFYPNVINAALDRLTILAQQNAEKIGRAVKVPISSATTPEQMATDILGSVAAAAASATSAANQAAVATNAANNSFTAAGLAMMNASNAATSAAAAADSAASFTSRTLTELADVDTTGAASGNALVFNGTGWVDGPLNLSSATAVAGLLPMARGGIGSSVATASDVGLPLLIGEYAGVPFAYPAPVATVGIEDAAVTYAKIQNVSATGRLLGRSSAGAGVVEEITCTAAGRALLDDADATAQRTTLSVPEITSGSWSPSSYAGFSSNPSITFNWERIGNTVTVRVASATDGTSNGDVFNVSGNMPAAITPAAARVAMLPVRLTVDFEGGGTHMVRIMLGIVNVGLSGTLGFSVPVSIFDSSYRESAGTNLAGGTGTNTSGGANAKGLVVGSCFTYLL